MIDHYYTKEQVLQRLRDHVRALGKGGQAKLSRHLSIPQSVLSDIFAGRQGIQGKILEGLGLRAMTIFVPIEGGGVPAAPPAEEPA